MSAWNADFNRYRIRSFPDGSCACFDNSSGIWQTQWPDDTDAGHFVIEREKSVGFRRYSDVPRML